jgi:hypothetical protein
MSLFMATIENHSLKAAPCITVHGTLSDAKRAASRRFAGGFQEHVMVIYCAGSIVSRKTLAAKRWEDCI